MKNKVIAIHAQSVSRPITDIEGIALDVLKLLDLGISAEGIIKKIAADSRLDRMTMTAGTAGQRDYEVDIMNAIQRVLTGNPQFITHQENAKEIMMDAVQQHHLARILRP